MQEHKINPLYSMYLQSPTWKEKADECKRLAGFTCSSCDNTENLHAHHITYENIGDEPQEDLLCLCKSCHEKAHDRKFTSSSIRGGFNMIYHKSYEQVTEEVIKSNTDMKVFNWITNLFTYKQVENVVRLSDCPIKISQTQFTRIVKDLVNIGYLLRVSKGIYRLNPFMYIPFRANGSELQLEWNEIINNKKEKNNGY